MKDWSTYFKSRLAGSGQFILEHESHLEGAIAITLTFKSTDANSFTKIQVGIMDTGDLITFEIHNPRTPGFNEQQKREYFYKYRFHPDQSYGDPGLEFIQINIDHFNKLLREGLKGKEIQYFKDGQLVKSEVFQTYADNSYNNFGTTIQFEKKGVWSRLLNNFKSKDELYDNKTEIELREIFRGLS